MSTNSGLAPESTPVVTGSRAMPQIGQAPGPGRRICGCMGQVWVVPSWSSIRTPVPPQYPIGVYGAQSERCRAWSRPEQYIRLFRMRRGRGLAHAQRGRQLVVRAVDVGGQEHAARLVQVCGMVE